MYNRIRAVRKALNLSQREFGEGLGVSRDVIGNIEYGRVPPKEPFLIHLCQQCRINRIGWKPGKGICLRRIFPRTQREKPSESSRASARSFKTTPLTRSGNWPNSK